MTSGRARPASPGGPTPSWRGRGFGASVIAPAAFLVACCSVAGCAQAEPRFQYDARGLEALILAELVPDWPELVADADCPERIGPSPGTVLCSAEIGGIAVDVRVDIDGRDRVELSTDDVFLVETDELEERGEQRLEADLGPVEVLCSGPALLVAVAGERLECEAVAPSGDRHPLDVEITSPAGDWEMRMRPRRHVPEQG